MSTHDTLKEQARAAINAVFSDRSVDPEDTIESLRELRDEVATCIDAIKSDLKNAK